MIEMSPAFSHESQVGPVFDITSWSPSKSIWMGVVGSVCAATALATATFLWHPKIMEGRMPPGTEHVVDEAIAAHRTHTWKMRGAMAVAGGLGWLFGVAAITGLRDGFSGNYYFRAGAGGLSLRLPHGVSWWHGGLVSVPLELDLPWDEIEGLTVVQTKQLGSMSRNAGNIGANLKIVMRSGQRHDVSLDGLEAAAYLIHERLIEAQETIPADLGEEQTHETGV